MTEIETNNAETPIPVRDALKDAFEELEFTKTAGYTHYNPSDAYQQGWRDAQIDTFLKHDSIEEPDVAVRRYSKEEIDSTVQKYESMLDILYAQPERSAEDEALIDRIIEKSGELFRYEELMLSVGAAATEDFNRHRRIASELSVEIMGGVDEEAAKGMINQLLDLAEKSESSYAVELRSMLTRQAIDMEKAENGIELTEKSREVLYADLLVLFPKVRQLLAGARSDDGKITPEQSIPIFNAMLEAVDLEDWGAEIEEGLKGARTSKADKKVYIGDKRDDFTSTLDALGTSFHESMHAARSEGIEMAGYRNVEEGITTLLQQIITGVQRTPGKQYYTAIALQAGVDRGGVPRSYRETFEIMWRRQALLNEQASDPNDMEKVRSDAQRQVQRTRRGGAIDGRDSSYFTAGQKTARWFNELAQLPEAERRSLLALTLSNRIDPTIPEHVAYARVHG